MKKKLEIGDKIARIATYGRNAVLILTVTRVTETMAFCKRKNLAGNEYEIKFPREIEEKMLFTEKGATGYIKDYYELATDVHFKQIKTSNLRHKIDKIDLSDVSAEKLTEILKILEQ